METQNKHDFKIKFEKTEHAINVDTYIQSLSALSVLLKEVNYQVDNSNPEVTINVVAEESGSFDVLLQIAEFVHDNHTIIRENVETLSWVVAIAVGVIQMHKWAKKTDDAKTEMNGNKVILKDSNNNVIHQTNTTVYNLYKTNQTVSDAISNQFQAVEKDKEIDAITIKNNDEVTQFSRNDFADLAEKRIIDTSDKEIIEVPAILTISKIVLDNRDRKWELVYQGNKINAKIVDDKFWQNVLAGIERFANGERLGRSCQRAREAVVIHRSRQKCCRIECLLQSRFLTTFLRHGLPDGRQAAVGFAVFIQNSQHGQVTLRIGVHEMRLQRERLAFNHV